MWLNRDVISILDFNKEELLDLFSKAKLIESLKENNLKNLKGKILTTAFFEPSTRTRLSFQAAMLKLGGSTLDLGEPSISSLAKGENISDTIRMLDYYSDIIVIRHKLEGVSRYAAEICEHPVINAGEGTKEHPTQTMIDLYEVWKTFKSLENLTYAIIGDIKHARTISSLILSFSIFKPRKVYLVSPLELRAKEKIRSFMEFNGILYEELTTFSEVLEEADVFYVTRIQKERFSDPYEYEKVKGSYIITLEHIKRMKEGAIILHPLPRVDELSPKVDSSKNAAYFSQARGGLYLRMALLRAILTGE
ncbi:MAG: aspartate carbamoyltransferase [Thermoproteota archaeon]|nr:aspartate carbamoyltransferase [Candidatus Brockarchaeota archaeon]